MGAYEIDIVLLKYFAGALVKPAYSSVLINISRQIEGGDKGAVGYKCRHQP